MTSPFSYLASSCLPFAIPFLTPPSLLTMDTSSLLQLRSPMYPTNQLHTMAQIPRCANCRHPHSRNLSPPNQPVSPAASPHAIWTPHSSPVAPSNHPCASHRVTRSLHVHFTRSRGSIATYHAPQRSIQRFAHLRTNLQASRLIYDRGGVWAFGDSTPPAMYKHRDI